MYSVTETLEDGDVFDFFKKVWTAFDDKEKLKELNPQQVRYTQTNT